MVENRSLGKVFRFIEAHRGYRPKSSVTLLYNRVLSRLAPERFQSDPLSALLLSNAEGTIDPYYQRLEAERSGANPALAGGVGGSAGATGAGGRASLTPRR